MDIKVTKKQLDMLKHAHGADSKQPGYRSQYCTRLDDKDMLDMVQSGLFHKPVGIGMVGEGHGIFHITAAGIKFIEKV